MFRFFEKLTAPFPEYPVEQPPRTLWGFFWFYCRGYKKALLALALATFVIACVEVSLFNFLGSLVDWLSNTDRDGFFQEHSQFLLVMSVVVLVVLPLAVVVHSMLVHQTLFVNMSAALRWQAHRYLLGQSHSFYQDEFAGRLSTKLMQTSESLRETVMKSLDLLLYVVVYLTGMVALVLAADWRLSLPLLVWLGCYLFLLFREVPRLKTHAKLQAEKQSEMVGRIVDSYTNFHTIKLFSHSDRESGYAKESMQRFLDAVYPLMRRVTGLNIALWVLNSLLIFSTAAVSIILWQQGQVTAGAITIAISLTLRLKNLSQFIMWEVAALFRNIGTVQNGMETIAQPYTVKDQHQSNRLTVRDGSISFRNVAFGYESDHQVIKQLSLEVKPGEKVGIVGSSGAGKSTLISLLLRLHDVKAGEILIDQQDIATVPLVSLRSNIGVVSQDTSLLHRSIRENIVYGKPDATEAEMIAAAKHAHVDGFIENMVDGNGRRGYDAFVGERGVKLSGGQRQRIAIARVLLKNAPILVLDEATSALDSEVEQAIQENLSALMDAKTVLAIAHRLSTIASMDRLIVVSDGQIIEQGSHAELLQQNGHYASLWKHQSGGFLGE